MYTEKILQSVQQFHDGAITEQEMLKFIFNRIAERMDEHSILGETQFDYVISGVDWYVAVRFEDNVWKVVERISTCHVQWKYEVK